jgi:hypothetical protein
MEKGKRKGKRMHTIKRRKKGKRAHGAITFAQS